MSIQSLFAILHFLFEEVAVREIGDYRDDGVLEEYFRLRLRMKGY